MAKRGRKVKYTKARIEEIRIALELYVEETEIPIVAEFAYKNNIPREVLYRLPELNHSIKKLIDKKESVLEQKGLKGELNR